MHEWKFTQGAKEITLGNCRYLDVVAMACRGDCGVEFDDLQILEVGSQKPSLG